jgi:streptomycin 6-kinase
MSALGQELPFRPGQPNVCFAPIAVIQAWGRLSAMSSQSFKHWLVRWQLTPDGAEFTTRFGSRLVPVLWRGQRAILKLAGNEEERLGGTLMGWYGGTSAARVLAREGDALLLERLTGERSLSDMARSGQDDDATRILCRIAMALHAPRDQAAPTGLIPLDTWFHALETAATQHGGTFATCASTARSLLADQREPVVLHGDFHHGNVLDGGPRGWLVIDPKGLVGERGFEYANLFRNPDLATALAPGQMRRAQIVSQEAGLDGRRLQEWVVAYAGLGAAWSLEGGDDPRPGLAIAEQAAADFL